MSPVIALSDLRKAFGATRAVDGVSFTLLEGEVHALVGENGAGKSTLMNMIAGTFLPDSGEIRVLDLPRTWSSTADALRVGIATVFQELSLVDGLSVAENISAGRAPTRLGLIDRRAMESRAAKLLARLGTELPLSLAVGHLLASQRQLVEIAKAIGELDPRPREDRDVRVLILDEPTSALAADDKVRLFSAVRALRDEGVGIIYISHHLQEVLNLADRITVLRDGATVWTRPAAGLTSDVLVRAMVGREVDRTPRGSTLQGAVVAEMVEVSYPGGVQGLSLSVHSGEIIAVAGLDGSGRESVARLLAGLLIPGRGRIKLNGQPHPGTLRAAMRRGVGYVPDDRKTQGLFLDLSIAANAIATDLAEVSRAGLVQRVRVLDAGVALIRDQSVKAKGPGTVVRALSGGNQQKVLLGKWLRRAPRLLIVEEPTKGVDINAKRDIHTRLVALARGGAAVVIVSSDLPEILELSDRIAVLHQGRLTGMIEARTATEETVLTLASGLVPDPATGRTGTAG